MHNTKDITRHQTSDYYWKLVKVKRLIGVHQKAKKPLLYNDLKKIIKVINASNESEFKKLRDKSIILIDLLVVLEDQN